MYVQGVSTRKVAAITEELCGFSVSSTQVSRATALLDEQLQAWRERPLGQYKYVYLDARYEKVRQDGQVRDAAVLIAVGVNMEGKREVLGISVALSEAEVHWRTFLQSLVTRGLSGVELIVSDAHTGLQQARKAVFGGIPWQRCQFHLQKNAQSYVPRQNMKAEVAADIRAIFNAPNRHEAESLLAREEYVEKRERILQSNVHLVEIDLLRRGRRVPMIDPFFTAVYDALDYASLIDYSRPPEIPLADEWAAWATPRLQSAGRQDVVK